jgi:hypothetical protein
MESRQRYFLSKSACPTVNSAEAARHAAGNPQLLGSPNMSWLNNLKIPLKVGPIVALMSIVTVGAVSFAALRIKGVDGAYSDLVSRVNKSTTMAVRASRHAEGYLASAFHLLTQTTDADSQAICTGR